MDEELSIKYVIENNIEGSLVECGVQEGRIELIWIKELKNSSNVRDIYMYDTFKGLTEPGEFDYACTDSTIYTYNNKELFNKWSEYNTSESINTWCYYPLDKLKDKLKNTGYPDDKLHYIEGDVNETLNISTNIPDKIALLRLDTDWYESSKIELEKLYDNVTEGGLIIFDDYFLWNGQKKAVDEFFKKKNLTLKLEKMCLHSSYYIKNNV